MLICHQDGVRDDVPASFWLRETIDPLEALALDLSRGHVLDAGAGAGLHSLALQRRGLQVTAIDIAPECVTIMRERGVLDARCADLFSYEGGPFDTIVCLCNGLDKEGRPADLPEFLDRMRDLLAPGGQLLADSFDCASGRMRAASLNCRARQPPVATSARSTCASASIAGSKGWNCELVERNGGHYLARADVRRWKTADHNDGRAGRHCRNQTRLRSGFRSSLLWPIWI